MKGEHIPGLGIIWGSFALVSLFTFGGDATTIFDFFLAIIYALAALSATYMITRNDIPNMDIVQLRAQVAEIQRKRKREENPRYTVEDMIENMSADERAALIERLNRISAGDDGEYTSLDEVMRQARH